MHRAEKLYAFFLPKIQHEEKERMRKETDLEEVKEIATLLLWLPPQATKFSPMIVKHPFTDCGMVVLRNSQQEPKPVNILESESAFSCWREEIGKRIKQAKSVQEIYPLVTKSYTFAFLKHTADYPAQCRAELRREKRVRISARRIFSNSKSDTPLGRAVCGGLRVYDKRL